MSNGVVVRLNGFAEAQIGGLFRVELKPVSVG